MSDNGTVLRPVSLARVIRKGFRAAYDHLGYVVFVTFASILIAAALISPAVLIASKVRTGIGGILLFAPAALLCYLWAVGVYYFVNKVVFHEHPVLADTWQGIKKMLIPALGLFVVDFVITSILAADTVFFLSMMSVKRNIIFTGIGLLFGYALIVWAMMVMYHLPLLIAQADMESGARARVILRKSFLLVADNPGFTVGLFLVIIAFAVLCIISAFIGMVLLFLGATAFITTHALRELFIKYNIVEEEPEVVKDQAWKLPDSWLKRTNREDMISEDTGGRTDG